MRVTSLIENETMAGSDELRCEFGLSLHIESAHRKILFDTGATGVFADNAAVLGIDLAAVDLAVLSHQHFDHSGGLTRFLEANEKATVHLRDSAIEERYARAFGVVKRAVGLDREGVDRYPDRFDFHHGDTEVAPGVWLLTEIPASHPRPKGNRRLFVKRDGRLEPDEFDHELVMVIREEDGIAVFSGCSHSGILNMVDAATESFPEDRIKAVFGGFHLIGLPYFNTMAASAGDVEDIARMMMDRVSGTVFTGHCTGKKGFGVLKGVMGDTLQPFSTGASVVV